MKNGQSAPNFSASCSNSEIERLRLNFSFSIFSTDAASDDPPPNPAPKGICLCNEYGRRATDIFQPVNDTPEDINYPIEPTNPTLLSSESFLRHLVHPLFQ